MLSFGFFKTRKARQFNYQPLHYDPDKEAREERRKELLGKAAIEEETPEGEYKPGMYIRGNMAARRGMSPRGNSMTKNTRMIRTISLIVILLLAAWFLMR